MYHEHQTFQNLNFNETPLEKGEYENCAFTGCDFSNADLSEFKLIECTFRDCNWSMVKVRGTALREIIFADCKILGVRFDECNAFGFSAQFVRNQLDHASFFQLKMNGTIFSHCRLRETDFTETELNGAVFEACDLEGAVFDHTQLQKADFRSAHGFVIDPETNDIRKAKFSPQGLIGLLHKYGIEVL